MVRVAVVVYCWKSIPKLQSCEKPKKIQGEKVLKAKMTAKKLLK